MATPTLTLLELNRKIKSALDNYFDAPIWIVAEINNINLHRSGHCYMELVQKASESDKIVAQTRATIWATQFRFISAYFQSVTGGDIQKGMNVLVKVSVDYHELYGISLNIREIDPAYTLGDLEKRKKEIIEKLITEGVFDMNKSLMLPSVIKRIAVISSPGAAGYEDFINHITHNKYDYKFEIKLFEADMQGENTSKSVVSAFNRIYETIDSFDIAVLIRGGGSKSDLSYFDNYDIAYYITQFPLPVISGIGHERDESVADMVAHTKMKTPTAVAGFIIDFNQLFENEVAEIFGEIISTAKDIIKNHEMYLAGMSLNIFRTKDFLSKSNDRCTSMFYRLKNASTRAIRDNERKVNDSVIMLQRIPNKQISAHQILLDNRLIQLKRSASNILEKQSANLSSLEQGIRLADPENVLKRGFSITKINGKILKSANNITAGDELQTITHSNLIISKVVKNETRKD